MTCIPYPFAAVVGTFIDSFLHLSKLCIISVKTRGRHHNALLCTLDNMILWSIIIIIMVAMVSQCYLLCFVASFVCRSSPGPFLICIQQWCIFRGSVKYFILAFIDIDNLENTIRLDDPRLRHVTPEDNSIYYNTENIHKLTNQNNNHQFSCLHLNIHSLPSEFDYLNSLLETIKAKNTKVDFICLWETFLSDQNTARYSIPGYNLIANNRHSK